MFAFRLRAPFCSLGLALFGCSLLAGCGQAEKSTTTLETDESQFRYGLQMEHDGRQDDALAAFGRVIKARDDDAPESHLESGQIYLNQKNDPISAIYHFQHFLSAKPKAEQAPMVRQLIETAEKNFARALPGHPGTFDEADLIDQLASLRAENENLRQQLGNGGGLRVGAVAADRAAPVVVTQVPVAAVPVARPAAASNARAAASVAANPARITAVSAARTYTVGPGDTLSSISQKELGNRSRWTEIFDANRDKLPSANSPLHIGMVLNLPSP